MRRVRFIVFALLAAIASGCMASGSTTDRSDPARSILLPSERLIEPFEVRHADGTPYELPFLGGFNVPRPQLVDIDGDGDPDLFVQEYTGSVSFLENIGTPGHPRFAWRSDRYGDLDVGEWYRFADVDGDGDFDLFAEEPYSHIRYYRNVGTPRRAAFVLAADTLRDAAGTPVFSDRQNIPNITDIDCDGASDLFIGRLDGTVMRYEAVEEEPVPIFELVADRFEDIEIVAQFGQPGNASPSPMPNIPGGSDPGRGPAPSGRTTAPPSYLHGANTMTFADIDGDDDVDLFWGDFFEPSLLRIENSGSCRTPSLRGEPSAFPPPDPIQSSGYNAPTFGDIDADGDMDLLVGVLGGAFNPNRTAHANLYYYEQLSEQQFDLRTRRFLDQIDVGSESNPSLVDLDGDGDQDLLVANKISSRDSQTSVLLRFENEGGTFQVRDSMALLTSYHYAPAFADLDGDEDLDMLLGTWNDGVAYYRNTGSVHEPRFELVQSGYVQLTRGSHTTPALGDLDADGDLDLLVGETSGTINFYENTGHIADAQFELVSDEYAGIDVGRRSAPMLWDVDGDGDLDLIVGSEADGLILFLNEGDATSPAFEHAGTLPHRVPAVAVPVLGDPDADGQIELLVGGLGGGLVYFDGP